MGRERMRKYFGLAVLVVALAVPAVALAATLQPSQIGSGCATGQVGTYHFVNNQTEGATAGLLSVTFDGVTTSGIQPYMVLRSVQHFSVSSRGTLEAASTNLPGNLVLSDFSCKKKG
jgi:hypothetical protein